MRSPRAAMQQPVLLNIGGSEYAATVDTLTQREPGSLLAAIFAGGTRRLPSNDGAAFVDRDGKQFRHVLNWLRDGAVPMLAANEYQRLLREAEYYRMHGLIDYIKERIAEEKVEESLGAELTRKDVIKCIQTEKVRFRGVNLSSLNLSKLVKEANRRLLQWGTRLVEQVAREVFEASRGWHPLRRRCHKMA